MIDYYTAASASEVQLGGPKTRRPLNADEHARAASLDRRAADAVLAEIMEAERRLAALRDQYVTLVGFAGAHEQLAEEKTQRDGDRSVAD